MNHRRPSTRQFQFELWTKDGPCYLPSYICSLLLLLAVWKATSEPMEPALVVWLSMWVAVFLTGFYRNFRAERTYSSYRIVVHDGMLHQSVRYMVTEDEPLTLDLKDIDEAVIWEHSPIMVELIGESDDTYGAIILETTEQLLQFEELLLEANPDVVIVRE